MEPKIPQRAPHLPARLAPAAMAFALLGAQLGAQTLFQGSTIFVGPNPRDVAAIDLNHDGYDDLLVTVDPTMVEIYLGGPGGSLTFSNAHGVTTVSTSVVFGDFNNDGNCDIVASANVASTFCYFGNGDGTFSATPVYSPYTIPVCRAGDIDGDGNLDLIGVIAATVVALGNGQGNFTPVQTIPSPQSCGLVIGGVGATGADFCDPDLDGDLDLAEVVAGWCFTPSNQVAYLDAYVNTGGSGYQLSDSKNLVVNLLGPLSGFPMRAADVTGDGLAEIIVGEVTFQAILATIEPSPAMKLSTLATCPQNDAPPTTRSLTLADISLEGKPDIVWIDWTVPSVHVTNAATGASSCATIGSAPVGPQPVAVTTGDFDGDGLADVAVACAGNSSVTVLLRRPTAVAGLVPYGQGTPGCAGKELLLGSPPATIGSTTTIQALSAPPSSLGLLLSSTAQDLAGSDPFGIGLLLHVGFAPPAVVYGADLTSDGFGAAAYQLSIPNDPILHGYQLYFQAIWLWSALDCPLPPFQLGASNGLALTFQ